jgi:cbb3-type cytochrome c oxidase subunit III
MVQILTLVTLLALDFGGWAVITVEDLPDQVVVGQPVTLDFTVRQHGRTLLSDLNARVVAAAGGERVSATAQPGSSAGRYRATITLPHTGAWSLTIFSGFGNNNVTLMPLPAVNPGQPAATIAADERGRRLFVAKGCLTCHVHPEVPGSGLVQVGPDLTGRRFTGDYLQRFLADPNIAATRGPNGFAMPDLGLAPREIAALAAFINGETATQSVGSR